MLGARRPGSERSGRMAIRVYDVNGRLVRVLHDAVTNPGRHLLNCDGRDDTRRLSASGIYFVEMRAPGFRKVGKVTKSMVEQDEPEGAFR